MGKPVYVSDSQKSQVTRSAQSGIRQQHKRPYRIHAPGIKRVGAVAILDALGSRGAWLRSDPISLLGKWEELLEGVKSLPNEFVGGPPLAVLFSPPRMPGAIAKRVEYFVLSDTLVVTIGAPAKMDDEYELQMAFGSSPIMAAILVTLMNWGFDLGFRFRGAMAIGRFYLRHNLFLGPAVDEAAEWYQKLNGAGVIVTPSLSELLDDKYREEQESYDHLFARWEIPIKAGPTHHGERRNGWMVRWPALTNPNRRNQISRLFLRDQPVTDDVATKRHNTLEFFDRLCISPPWPDDIAAIRPWIFLKENYEARKAFEDAERTMYEDYYRRLAARDKKGQEASKKRRKRD